MKFRQRKCALSAHSNSRDNGCIIHTPSVVCTPQAFPPPMPTQSKILNFNEIVKFVKESPGQVAKHLNAYYGSPDEAINRLLSLNTVGRCFTYKPTHIEILTLVISDTLNTIIEIE